MLDIVKTPCPITPGSSTARVEGCPITIGPVSSCPVFKLLAASVT
ncbi:hypothetical protein [Nocardioides sp. B-3]|nr:hypothetical protein [Nocardioides sp. B-3]